MPTKRRRRSRGRVDPVPELTPAARYVVMTGFYPNSDDPDGHMSPPYGWLDVLFRIRDAAGSLSEAMHPLVEAHRHELEDEAARYRFTPWFVGHEHPTGRGYRRWRADFVRTLRFRQDVPPNSRPTRAARRR